MANNSIFSLPNDLVNFNLQEIMTNLTSALQFQTTQEKTPSKSLVANFSIGNAVKIANGVYITLKGLETISKTIEANRQSSKDNTVFHHIGSSLETFGALSSIFSGTNMLMSSINSEDYLLQLIKTLTPNATEESQKMIVYVLNSFISGINYVGGWGEYLAPYFPKLKNNQNIVIGA